VVSFADRQLLDLKDRNRQLEARLAQLVRHGEQNDQTLARTHKLSLALMKALTLSEVHSAILQVFSEHFGLNRVAIRLWHDAAANTELYNARQGQPVRALLWPLRQRRNHQLVPGCAGTAVVRPAGAAGRHRAIRHGGDRQR